MVVYSYYTCVCPLKCTLVFHVLHFRQVVLDEAVFSFCSSFNFLEFSLAMTSLFMMMPCFCLNEQLEVQEFGDLGTQCRRSVKVVFRQMVMLVLGVLSVIFQLSALDAKVLIN